MCFPSVLKRFCGIAFLAAFSFVAVGVPWIDPNDVDADPPAVQTSGAVAVNRWTNQYQDALAASKTLNRPVLVAVATSKKTCKACKKWYKALEDPAWPAWLARHPMVLVFINYASDRALYDDYHSLFKGELSDTWPTLAVLAPGSSPSAPDVLAKLDEDAGKESIYSNIAKFTDWLGGYVYGYESATVSLGDPPGDSVHEGETVAGTVSRAGSSFGEVQATVRVTVDGRDSGLPVRKIVWPDGESGSRSFSFDFDSTEAYEAPRRLRFLLTATNLTDVTVTVTTNTVSYSITNGVDSVETNELSQTVTTNYSVTVTNRVEISTNTVAKGSIALTYGRQSFEMTLLDQMESRTFEQFKSENGGLASLTPDAKTPWFVGTNGLLQTPPVATNTEVALTWQAPAPGYLRYHLRERDADAVTVTNTLSFQAGTNDWSILTNNILRAETVETNVTTNAVYTLVETTNLCIAVAAGDRLKFSADTTATNTVLEFAELSFTPFSAAVTRAGTPSDAVSYDDFAADPSLLDLSWDEPASAGDDRQRSVSNRLFYTAAFSGGKTDGVVELGTATATNACDAGMVAPTEDYAHGTLACRLDWLADLSSFDFATRDEIWVTGVTRTFTFSTKPVFIDGVPGEGAVLYAYLRVASRIPFTAVSKRSVAYQITGLPAGMAFDKTTGVLSGKPKKQGTYRVTVTATSGGDSEIRNVTLIVAKLPARLRNKAYGVLLDAAGGVFGTAEFSVSAVAKLTAKFTLRTGRVKASAVLESGADGGFSGADDAKGVSLKMEAGGLWHGRYKEYGLLARAVKGVSFAPVADTYTLNLFAPEGAEKTGYGYLTAKIAKTGNTRVKGVMPDAKPLSTSVRPIRATVGELASSGIPMSALPGLSAYGGGETVFLVPVFVRKSRQKCYALGIVGSSSPKELRVENIWYAGVSQWTLAAGGFPYRKKQTGAFAGKGLSVYRGGGALFADVPLTGNFALAGAPAGCRLKLAPSSGIFTLKFRDGKKTVSVKGAAVTGSGTATGVGKSANRIYYAVID